MSVNEEFVPIVDITALYGADSVAKASVDRALGEAARNSGGFVVTGMPENHQIHDENVAPLHRFFDLSQAERNALATQRNVPENKNRWRGYNATLKGGWAHNEMYDVGPEHPYSYPDVQGVEILNEPNSWPANEPYVGWQAAMMAQFERMHQLSILIIRALGRVLGSTDEGTMSRFATGYSTLRLLNYPKKPAGLPIGGSANATRTYAGQEQSLLTVEHEDSCTLSMLWQDPNGGLQFQNPSGQWLTVPKVAGGVSIHLGMSIRTLSGGHLRPTPHRVLGEGGRQSMGFFLEPDLDATLAPLTGIEPIEMMEDEDDSYAVAMLKVLLKRGQYTDLIAL